MSSSTSTTRRTVGVATALLTMAAAVATGPAAGTASAGEKPRLSVCYEAENQFGQWLPRDQGCDGDLVAPSGGIHGLAVTVKGVRQVLYSASDGVDVEDGKDGDQVNAGDPTTELRVKISPREKLHLVYTVTWDDAGAQEEAEETARDNAPAGNDVDTITSLRMAITR